MFRVGIVKALDLTNHRVRVTFPDRDQLQSWWLGVRVAGTQNDKMYWMPDVGEQVTCDMDEHDEDGTVTGSIYSTTDQPPANMTADKRHITFKDGATFEYDRSSHALAISIPSNGTVSIATNNATISIDASGNINLTAKGDIKFVTDAYRDSVDNMITTYNEHTHQFTDSHGDTGPTQVPTQRMP